MLWVGQVNVYINYLTFEGRESTNKNHAKDECVEFVNVNQVGDQTLNSLIFYNHIFRILCLL
jgi:hypothetical protein